MKFNFSRRKEIIKIRVEINGRETKRSMKLRADSLKRQAKLINLYLD